MSAQEQTFPLVSAQEQAFPLVSTQEQAFPLGTTLCFLFSYKLLSSILKQEWNYF